MSTLVLNNAFQPIGAASETDAVILVAIGKAWSLKDDPMRVYHSQKIAIPAPKIVVLNHYKKPSSFKIRPAVLTNRSLFERDGHTCQYCGKHKDELKGTRRLTRDHIYPRSLGGRDEWLNVTTACNACNFKKGKRTLEETGMRLKTQPTVPVTWTIRGKSQLNKEQIEYVEDLLNLKNLD